MSDEKQNEDAKLCNFAPDEEKAVKADEILYRKTRSLKELDESSDRCLKHVSERLDQIEEEILADSKSRKTD